MLILLPKNAYHSAVLVLLAALVITFFKRAPYYDEAWFAEQSFWLIRDGKVRSELFRGYNGWENGIYVFHKLFVYAGALIMSITGITVATSKLVSILFGLLGGGLLWVHGKRCSREQQWLALFLYFGCGTLIRYISVNRPETMCMALGFASYLALDPLAKVRPKSILGGVLAGLAALTHLNGLIYLIAGTIWLFVRMGRKSAFVFAMSGSLTLSLYGLDALLDGNLALLVQQFFNDPATQKNLHLSDKLAVLADYHQIFFHSQNEAALSVLVILGVIAFRKKIRVSQPVLLYTILLLISFWLLTKSDTDIYFLLFLPWLASLAASWLIVYLSSQSSQQKWAGRILLFGYSLVTVVQLYFVLMENQTVPDIEQRNSLLASYMPRQHTEVIAPIGFFFGQVDRYKIRGLTSYYLLERATKKIPLSSFFAGAAKDKVEYIISGYGKDASYNIPADAPIQIGVYQRVYQDELNSVYARQHTPI